MKAIGNVEVEYKDVGRMKKCWKSVFPNNDNLVKNIWKDVRTNGGLLSGDLEVETFDDGTGRIIVGGFRAVGTFVTRPAAA